MRDSITLHHPGPLDDEQTFLSTGDGIVLVGRSKAVRGLVLLSGTSDLTPAEARRVAAHIAAYADEAERDSAEARREMADMASLIVAAEAQAAFPANPTLRPSPELIARIAAGSGTVLP